MFEPLGISPRKYRRMVLAIMAAFCAPIMLTYTNVAAASTAEPRDSFSYVLLDAGSRDSTMSGSMEDLRRARSMRAGQEGLLYIRDGRAAYVIRDAATLREAEAIFEPQKALGARQAELGSRQAALGQRQARLGAQQARIGRQQAGASPGRAEELGRQQDALGRQQDELGSQQDALGRRQDAFGREQDRLGRDADARIRALVAEALRGGLAQRID